MSNGQDVAKLWVGGWRVRMAYRLSAQGLGDGILLEGEGMGCGLRRGQAAFPGLTPTTTP